MTASGLRLRGHRHHCGADNYLGNGVATQQSADGCTFQTLWNPDGAGQDLLADFGIELEFTAFVLYQERCALLNAQLGSITGVNTRIETKGVIAHLSCQ